MSLLDINLRYEFIRSYIRYLLDEVTVVPIETLEIKTLSGTYHLVANEETRIPRWLAYILKKKNKIRIKEENPRELIGRLTYYVVREKDRAPLSAVEKGLYFRVKEYTDKLANQEMRERIITALKEFMKIRLPKILRRALTTGQEKDMLLWEDILARYMKDLSETWMISLIKTDLTKILYDEK